MPFIGHDTSSMVELQGNLRERIPESLVKQLGFNSKGAANSSFPVSPAQQDILSGFDSPRTSMFISLPKHVGSSLDYVRMIWQAMVTTHPILRTVIQHNKSSGRPTHHVTETLPPIFEMKDLVSGSSASFPNSSFLVFGTGSNDNDAENYVILNISRILVDANSLGFLKLDFLLLFCGLSINKRASFRHYIDYLECKSTDAGRDFFKAEFAGLTSSRFLFLPKIGPADIITRRQIVLESDNHMVPKLIDFENRSIWSRQLLFEAVWAMVVAKHAGSDKAIFATSGRDATFSGYESCIGRLDHVYPVHVQLDEGDSLQQVLETMNKYHNSASSHAWIGVKDIMKTTGLSQIQSFVCYTAGLDHHYLDGTITDFPLMLHINGIDHVRVSMCFNETVAQEQADVLLHHFMILCSNILDQSEALSVPLGNFDMVMPEALPQDVTASSAIIPPPNTTVVDLLRSQAEASPSSPAVQFEGQDPLTFADFDELTDKLVSSLDIRPKTYVPICMEKSVLMIASVWAVLKAGAAYIMLDPEGARARNASIVQESDAPFVLTDEACSSLFDNTKVVTNAFKDTSCPKQTRRLQVESTDPAYVVYTSGSTGRPKGVVISHAAAMNGIVNFQRGSNDRYLLFYNQIFSAAQRAMLAPIAHGACLCLASRTRLLVSLSEVLDNMDIDSVGLTTSALTILEPEHVPTLREITATGEQMNDDVIQKWAGSVSLKNSYGLSECTQLSCGRVLVPGSNPRIVGQPNDTTRAIVLRPETLKPVSIGVPGELCLMGPQLSEGYLNQPDQTAKVFVQNPFGPGKLYRTGDLALKHVDGSIEIFGRIDSQIKINGQRIEPREVLEAIKVFGQVKDAFVLPIQLDDTKALTASIVLEDGHDWYAAIANVKEDLRHELPGYMIPSFWLPYDKIPRNANGKVDIKNIEQRAMDLGRQGMMELQTKPTSKDDSLQQLGPLEAILADALSSVLSLPIHTISQSMTFADLGGNSLQAIKVAQLIRNQGYQVELGSLLRTQSLGSSAASLRKLAAQEELLPFSLLPENLRGDFENRKGVLDAFPASALQEGTLAATLNGDSTYLYQRVFSTEGVDLTRLRQAFEHVFEARAIYRTTFTAASTGFVQVLRSDMDLPWSESQQSLSDYKKFDLELGSPLDGPMMRVAIIQQKYLLVTMHHSLFDFWSHKFLYEDVTAAYNSAPLVPRASYSDFVFWLQRRSASKDVEFWTNYLGGADRTILAVGPEAEPRALEKKLKVNLSALSSTIGRSSGVLVYTAWSILLALHTGNEDVVFATTLSGREAPVLGIDTMDGPTLTTVPQRVTVSRTITLRDLAGQVSSGLWDVIEHSQFGMRRALSSVNTGSRILDTLVNVLVSPDRAEGSNMFQRHGERPVWQSEYTALEVEEQNDCILARLSTAIDGKRATFILEQFATILQQFEVDPDVTIAQLNLIGSEESALLTSMAAHSTPTPNLLHQPFEDIASADPSRPAVEHLDGTLLTYGELNYKANALAVHLLQSGISAGDLIPLFMDKSLDLYVAILGVLKAGAAYVPISPGNPAARNSYIVSEIGAKWIITQSSLEEFAQANGLQAILMDSVDLSTYHGQEPHVDIDPKSIAYTIYTSGSTGNPKGVAVPHASSAAAVTSMAVVEGRTSAAWPWRVLQFANYVFDASVQDIFNTWSSGGTLCIASQDDMLSDVQAVISKMKIRQVILTPTVAKLMSPKLVPTLETLILGGEPMTPDIVEIWANSVTLLNVYGPTETSMVVTTKQVLPNGNPKNIGKPFPTVGAMMLKADSLQLVPLGAVGELCISGPQLARGYLNQPGLTSKAFLESQNGNMIYRTGDLARWLPNGEVECLGRIDNQVKISGHRIELGEIEGVIQKSGLCNDNIVIVANIQGKPQLIGFTCFSPSEGGDIVLAADETFLDNVRALHPALFSLAHYMVPKYLVPVGRYPLLPSRKVDRKAMKALAQAMTGEDLLPYSLDRIIAEPVEVVPVATEEEKFLENAWSELFGISTDHIGRNASFFGLGGDSISAINLVSTCRKSSRELSVSQVLEANTLADMASHMHTLSAEELNQSNKQYEASAAFDAAREEAMMPANAIAKVFPSPPGQSEFLDQGARQEQFWALLNIRQLPDMIDLDSWIQCVEELTKTNEVLRSTFVKLENEGWVCAVLASNKIDITIVDCSATDRERIIEEQLWSRPFVFGKPFVSYMILRLDDGSREVAVKMDHAIYDGTLLRIFDEQLSAIQQGNALPEVTQFSDFALHHWQAPKAKSQAFWSKTLEGYSFTQPQMAEPKIDKSIMHNSDIELDRLAQHAGVTVPVIFQAAFQIWLARSYTSKDVGFDYLLTGRNVAMDNPQLINGTCAQFLPMRSTLEDEEEQLASYLSRTQADFWKATEHASLSLDDIWRGSGFKPRTEDGGNRALFLFQPFEPAEPVPEGTFQWVVMKGAKQIRMYQPYALVVEVGKRQSGGHTLKIMFDQRVMDATRAKEVAVEIEELTKVMSIVSVEENMARLLR